MKSLTLSILLLVSSTALCRDGKKHDEHYYRQLIAREAISVGFPADLAISVAIVESGLNPEAVGTRGEIGLFQLMPRGTHKADIHDPKENTRQALMELMFWQRACPTTDNYTFVICYNGGYRDPKYPDKHPYYRKVMQAMR